MLSLALPSVNNLCAEVVVGDLADLNRICDFIFNALASRMLWHPVCFGSLTALK